MPRDAEINHYHVEIGFPVFFTLKLPNSFPRLFDLNYMVCSLFVIVLVQLDQPFSIPNKVTFLSLTNSLKPILHPDYFASNLLDFFYIVINKLIKRRLELNEKCLEHTATSDELIQTCNEQILTSSNLIHACFQLIQLHNQPIYTCFNPFQKKLRIHSGSLFGPVFLLNNH